MSFSHSIAKLHRVAWCIALTCLASACTTTDEPQIVRGRIMGTGTAGMDTELFTQATQGMGVTITSTAGRGIRPAVLSSVEAIRLIDRMEAKLNQWQEFDDKPPFEETVMLGLAGTTGPQPFSVILARKQGMTAPVFVVTIAYTDALASVALDRDNARKWVAQLKQAAGYGS